MHKHMHKRILPPSQVGANLPGSYKVVLSSDEEVSGWVVGWLGGWIRAAVVMFVGARCCPGQNSAHMPSHLACTNRHALFCDGGVLRRHPALFIYFAFAVLLPCSSSLASSPLLHSQVFGGHRNVTKDSDVEFLTHPSHHDNRPHAFHVRHSAIV